MFPELAGPPPGPLRDALFKLLNSRRSTRATVGSPGKETAEQRALRLQKQKERDVKRYGEETPDEYEARLEKQRLYIRQRRMAEKLEDMEGDE